ncbi:MAG TPA: MFS transporter [Longimicrobiales bacterium]|nr:MFS transporter [Longimicrobiales bacterium]
MSLWFTASAVTPYLQLRWSLDAAAAGWLTTVVQLGFVAGTAAAALLNLADIWPARWYVATSALLAALANALVIALDDYTIALLARFCTGLFLAGVYPPGMKMMATWFVQNRGLAIGALVGGITVGKAAPYLIRALDISANFVMLSASAGAAAGGLMVALWYKEGPHAFERRSFSWSLVGTVLHHRPTRLAIAGYLGHMWELYAMWTLVAVFFFDFFRMSESASVSASWSGVAAFAVIGAGGLGCVLAGQWADRIGRERVTIWSMVVSGMCSLIMGWLMHAPPALALALALIWGFAVVADSAQFSALVTEVAPRHAVGTALTLQTSLGFLLTAFTIWWAIELREAFDWRVAFSMLAVGPALGIVAMARLRRLRSKPAVQV